MNKEIYNKIRNVIIYLFIQSSLGFYKILLNIKKIKNARKLINYYYYSSSSIKL